jgi:hypothetical protein
MYKIFFRNRKLVEIFWLHVYMEARKQCFHHIMHPTPLNTLYIQVKGIITNLLTYLFLKYTRDKTFNYGALKCFMSLLASQNNGSYVEYSVIYFLLIPTN